MFVAVLPGCFDEPTCPYGEVLVHDGSYGGDDVCVRRSYYTSPSGGAKPGTDAGPYSSPVAAPGAATDEAETGGGTTTTDPGSTPSPVAAACGGLAAQSDSVRVVDKSDVAPSFGDASVNLADGSYTLVQASFFRITSSASPVRSLKATIDVRGPTLTVNAQETSIAGSPNESLTLLLASSNVMTKTCEGAHGSISAWLFPFVVGATAQPQLQYDANSGFFRLLVSRADGATELVFVR